MQGDSCATDKTESIETNSSESDSEDNGPSVDDFIHFSAHQHNILAAIHRIDEDEEIVSPDNICDVLSDIGFCRQTPNVRRQLDTLVDEGILQREPVDRDDDRYQSQGGSPPSEYELESGVREAAIEFTRQRLDTWGIGPADLYTIDEVAQADYATRSGSDDDDGGGGMSPEQIRRIVSGGAF